MVPKLYNKVVVYFLVHKFDNWSAEARQGMNRIREEIDDKKKACFTLDDQGVLWFKNRLVVPKDMELRKRILDEAHTSMFTVDVS